MKKLLEQTNKYELGRLLEQSELSRRKLVVEAWKHSPYLKGLRGRDLGNMSIMSENQKRQIIKENNTTADMAVFDTIAIPMIRRQNQAMVTPNLISVQPLSYPNGLAFYLDYKVSNTKKPIAEAHFANNLSGGQADNFTGNTFETTSGYDRHLGNAGYDNTKGRILPRGWNGTNFNNSASGSINDTANAASFTAAGVNLGGAGVSNFAVVDFDLTAVGGITMDQVASIGISESTGTLVQGKDYFVQRVQQNYSDDILSTGGRTGTTTTSTAGRAGGPGDSNKVLRFRIIPTAENLGTSLTFYLSYNEYLNLELNAAFSSELKLDIVQVPIQSQIHKMKVAWTVELAQDLMAYHAIDAEAEIVQLLSEEVAAEKDRLIIRELVNLAGHFEVWNADFYKAVDPNPANTVFRGTESAYNQGLVYAINRANGKIQKSTRRGGANWVLISAEGAAKMMNLDVFKPMDADDEGTKFASGVERMGTLQSKYTVYVDPNLPAEVCLVGRKGTSFFDTGYVYCPYIEYMLSPVVIEDQEFNPRRMISSRFATKMLNNRFYCVVWMKNIEQFTVLQPNTGSYVL
jgi:hypothetical protein